MEEQGLDGSRIVRKSPAQGQSAPSPRKCQFRSCFVFLLAVTLSMPLLLYISDDLSIRQLLLQNMTQTLNSYYRTTHIFQLHKVPMVSQTPSVSALPATSQGQGENPPSVWTAKLKPREEITITNSTVKVSNLRNLLTTKMLSHTLKKTLKTTSMIPLSPTVIPKLDHIVYPKHYHFVLDEPEKCSQLRPFLVLMVPVAPANQQAREAIRRTWGNESVVQGKVVSVLFMLGQPVGANAKKIQEMVQLESQEHHDLLQSNVMDTYGNLTIKTMLIMEWLATRCSNASYAMKIDSDMFLNVENLMTMLLAPSTPNENYITGMLMWNRPVIRNRNSKWYVPENMYPESTYPTYLLGMGYVFSNDLAEKLVRVSKDVKPFNIEDAYVGACLKRLGIGPSNPPNPWQFRTYVGAGFPRGDLSKIITLILHSPQQLVDFWRDLKSSA